MNFSVGDKVRILVGPEEMQNEVLEKVDGATATISEIYQNSYEPDVDRYEVELDEPVDFHGEDLIVIPGLYEDNLEAVSSNVDEAKVTGRSGPYFKGLNKSQKDKKEAQIKRQSKMSDSDPSAYKPMPGDLDKAGKFKGSKVKSKATEKINKELGMDESRVLKFSEFETINEISAAAEKSLKKKAEAKKMPYGVLKQVFNRGMAAWKTGHRPGQSQEAWAHARVNSFVTKSPGTWGKADKDLAQKVRKSK
jgi:Family of unknown function (DUF5824)